ncbi:cytochrome o ubiquinol oxidase subunit 3 (plasmid) [Paraburkholderia fungorum]|jgi:cytochrome o ubiquinol oxidase subunit III|uniref:Cytochrome bo(3) ubiquinol oxidase subunit 3 n=1 Tax=Paraburkholderia fungorum TaxID=134537 RepID=A0AAP5QD23_9BURK|nr:cytochrome c oxidase subunit 3 [Paraburkholderia fungorum]AJZ56344.1 cytochrome o ubiquinol oxidase subunit 3 [Paraburkholderia fungorum]MBB5545044.1 cytochrome o ubiquinol oxidase subunit 3 [Paraburkholderia fungorum]MBU7443246.1 cytochrome c oxidase subunit 3 [Paraburkholderia fungorum]MDE1009007.1 cytochrome c oxidase subunit 3 [Paraburkholderia fungorum]MDT8840022.1 cytochrome c oxidase subunit 3 [Paraburkholderia fungorum]
MSRPGAKYPGLNLTSAHGVDDAEAENLMFGFWVFLMSDAILFGMVFASYATSLNSTAGGPGPHQLFDINSAFIETVLLLASSTTFGMASLALKYKRGTLRLIAWLTATVLLGVVFLGFELHDFSAMLAKGGGPGRSGYLSAFFGLVPLHGLHVLGGCIWLLCLVGQIARYGVDTAVKIGIMRLALFWHFLDIVWVAIFSVVYLGGLT